MKQKITNKEAIKEIGMGLLFSFLVAGITITFCSRSSFLAPFNNWDDANSYFSMGKALFNGKIIYRDILDQKGPYLYFLYGLAYLMSHQDFAGVYVIEVIMAGMFMYGCLRIMRLYVRKTISAVLLPLLSAVIYSSVSFYWGGSAEEFCLPFFVWPLYILLRYFKEDTRQAVERKYIMAAGICAGIVALIKFNSLGFFASWMLVVVVIRISRKEYKEMFLDCAWFLFWMFVPFIPWIIYFAANNALFYWYQGYIYYNVFIYADFSREKISLGTRVYKLAKILYWLIIEHIQYFAFIILGVLTVLFHPKRKWLEKFAITAMCFFLFLGIYIGGVELKYYSLPLAVFAVFGFCSVGMFIQYCIKDKICSGKIMKIGSLCISILLSVFLMRQLSLNTEYMETSKEDLYLYRLYSHMDVQEDTTLLNISCFDVGLYTIADIVPTCYWFQTQTLPIDDVLIEQERYIRTCCIEYIVARDYYPACVEEGYELIASEEEKEREHTYYLFRKK